MSRIIIIFCFFTLAAALPNDGQEPKHEEDKHSNMPVSETPKSHDTPKVSGKPSDSKPAPVMTGHNEQKN
ncbi:unnamed protein product, partial [Iphiclides podalirius]